MAMRFTFRILLVVVVALVALAVVSSARATSIYDNILVSTPTLTIGGEDITTTWYAKMTEWEDAHPGNTAYANAMDKLRSNMDEGVGWAVFQCGVSDAQYAQVVIPDANRTGYFGYVAGQNRFMITNDNNTNTAIYLRIDNSTHEFTSDVGSNCATENGNIRHYTDDAYNAFPLFINFPITYPSGYEGGLIPTEQPNAKYVAMGDSFSSGEGNSPFEYGTNDDSVNECHRSTLAYPRLLQNDSSLDLGPTAFVACSGATTSDVLYGDDDDGNWTEGPQVDVLSADTEVVTISIGGNDVGFSAFATECLSPFSGECDSFTPIYDDVMDSIQNDLGDNVTEVYEEILDAAPNAEIYVVGYPHLAPYHSYVEDEDEDCTALFQPFGNAWGNGRAAYDVTNAIDDVLEESVDAINLEPGLDRLTFVDTREGAFDEHDTCSDDSYFNAIDYVNQEYTAHPNSEGHVAYKEDIDDYLD